MKAISTVLAVILGIVLISVLLAFPTQWLWNTCLVPAIDGVNSIGLWQALGLNVLTSILFKNNQIKKTEG